MDNKSRLTVISFSLKYNNFIFTHKLEFFKHILEQSLDTFTYADCKEKKEKGKISLPLINLYIRSKHGYVQLEFPVLMHILRV